MFLPAAGVFPSLRKRLKLVGGEGVGRQWGWWNGRDAQSVLEINRSRIIPVLIGEFLVFENIISRSGTGERRRGGEGGRVRDGIAWSDRTRVIPRWSADVSPSSPFATVSAPVPLPLLISPVSVFLAASL